MLTISSGSVCSTPLVKLYHIHDLAKRILLASLSGAFGGLLASALIKLNGHGNLAGWRWIFILEGIASTLAGCYAMIFLPESLRKAKFLTEEERIFAGGSVNSRHFVYLNAEQKIDSIGVPWLRSE